MSFPSPPGAPFQPWSQAPQAPNPVSLPDPQQPQHLQPQVASPFEPQAPQYQQPAPSLPPPSQHYSNPPQVWQQQQPQQAYGFVKQPSRNIGMIIGGSILLVIALAAGVFFFINLHQYLTIEDRWANDPLMAHNTTWIVELIKRAAMKRMVIFGSVMGLTGIGGFVLGGLGLRKK